MRGFQPKKVPAPPGDFSIVLEMIKDFNSLDVEIGCGVGMHPISHGKTRPDRLLLAMERTTNKFRKLKKNINQARLRNVVPLHTDAINWISHFLGPKSVENYFILYPNPYPKEKHSNLRLVNMPFMSHLISTLKSNGSITIATNVSIYAEEAKLGMLNNWKMTLLSEEVLSPTFSPRTHFEKKYLKKGDPCVNLVFQKSTSCPES